MKNKRFLRNIVMVMVIFAAMLACHQNANPPPAPKDQQEMVDTLVHMNPKKPIIFKGYPVALDSMKYISYGTIFVTPKGDIMELITKLPNPADRKNRYITYFIKYHNGNNCYYWWMYRDGDNYVIYREDNTIARYKESAFKRERWKSGFIPCGWSLFTNKIPI